jgi:pilus assembly protein CpaB
MNVKKIAPLIVALILGGIAAKMAFDFVQKRQGGLSAELKHPQMVVAKQSVEAGTALTEEDLALGDVSSDTTIPETAFTSVDQLVGRVTVVPLLQGQAITTTLLAPKGMGAGLQAAVPLGMRAVTVEINEITGVAGYLGPGCHVDVIQTLKDDKTGMPMARTLAQNVKITAIGMRHNPQDGDGGGRSVTLLVTPAQAELMELASSIGRPRFTLRNGDDLAVNAEPKGVTLAELLGHHASRDEFSSEAAMATTQPSATVISTAVNITTRPSNQMDSSDDQWTIEVIRGGSAQEVKFSLHSSDEQFSKTDLQYIK